MDGITVKPACLHCGKEVPRVRNKYCSRACKDAATVKVFVRDGLKRCTKCTEWKPLSEYGKGRDPFGLNHMCFECDRTRTRAYEAINASARKAYREANIQRRRATYQRWREQNPDYNKQYYAEKRGWHLERLKKWQRENPDQVKVQHGIRRARRVNAEGRYTASEWRNLKAHYKHQCLCCGKSEPEIRLTPDHVIPLSKGGSNSIDNIQPLCGPCNSSKRDKATDYRNGGSQ